MPSRLRRGAAAVTAAALVGRAGCAPAVGDVRGVAPADQAKYVPSAGTVDGATFRCLNLVAGAASYLPFAWVNDDFCDCPDGSDEPGTSACAGQKETLYYCKNAGSDPAFIYTSRVNDGICDCCDGSDEWRASASKPGASCPNTCAEEGRTRQKEHKRLEADLRSGIKQRHALVEAARVRRRSGGEELQRLQKELPLLEDREREAKAAFEAAEQAHREAEQRPEHTAPEGNTSDPQARPAPEVAEASKDASTGSAGATDSGSAGDSPATSEEGPVGSEYAKWMDSTDKASEDAPKEATTKEGSIEGAKGDGTVVSEYTKWMDGAQQVLQEDLGPTAAGEVREEEEEGGASEEGEEEGGVAAAAAGEPEDAGFLVRQWRKVSGALAGLWRRVRSPAKSPTQRARDAADQAHQDAQKRVRENRARTEELRKLVDGMADEDSLAYSGLDGRCISKKFTEYKYEVCFFKTAKQDSVSIGRWKSWEQPGVALFDGGQNCPGGPERSLRVLFQCGSKEELLEVTEPSRCTYEAKLMHPAACTEALLQALESQGPRMPTDEL